MIFLQISTIDVDFINTVTIPGYHYYWLTTIIKCLGNSRWHQDMETLSALVAICAGMHDDVIIWNHFPHYWPFAWGIHWSLVNSPLKGQWHGALMFSLICAGTNNWVNNRDAHDLRHHHTHYDATVMPIEFHTHRTQYCKTHMYVSLLGWTNCWTNYQFAGDFRCHNADVISLCSISSKLQIVIMILLMLQITQAC